MRWSSALPACSKIPSPWSSGAGIGNTPILHHSVTRTRTTRAQNKTRKLHRSMVPLRLRTAKSGAWWNVWHARRSSPVWSNDMNDEDLGRLLRGIFDWVKAGFVIGACTLGLVLITHWDKSPLHETPPNTAP